MKKKINNERDLQEFIALNPWLINLNYETIPNLPNNGMEYITSNQKRIDLILRDRVIGNPVIVEFKFTPFYRENIGQILEYKTRVITEINKNESLLFNIFDAYISIPKMVLVVKESDDFSKIACNMNGIEIVEFKKFAKEISLPGKFETLNDFSEKYKDTVLPISFNRGNEIEKLVYQKIKDILLSHGFDNELVTPRNTNGYFYTEFNTMFINRWLFSNEEISIGIYEDIIDTKKVVISFYITNKEIYIESLEICNQILNTNLKNEWNDVNNEGYINSYFQLKQFIEKIDDIFTMYLNVFIQLRKNHLTTAST